MSEAARIEDLERRVARLERTAVRVAGDDVRHQPAMSFEQCGRCGVFVSPIHGYLCGVAECPRRASPA